MRPVRRSALLLLLALVLGVITVVGSALALAAWMPMEMYPRQRSYSFLADGRPWNAVERQRRGVWNIWWSEINAHYLSPPPPPPPERFIRESFMALLGQPPGPGPGLPRTAEEWLAHYRDHRDEARARRRNSMREFDHSPGWGSLAGGRAPPVHVATGSDHGFGWPRPALWYRVNGVNYFAFDATGRVLPHASATDIAGGYLLSGSLQSRGYSFRALPYRVHWAGLISNSVLAAGLWFMVLFGPRAVRRGLRRRRGRCITCGYDLRGLGAGRCPECGVG